MNDAVPVFNTFSFKVQANNKTMSAECINLLSQAMDAYEGVLSAEEKKAIAAWFSAIYGGAA